MSTVLHRAMRLVSLLPTTSIPILQLGLDIYEVARIVEIEPTLH